MNRFALKTFMLLRNWNAAQLAERIPCTAAHIRLCRQGKRQMSPAMSERIKSLPKNAKPVKHS